MVKNKEPSETVETQKRGNNFKRGLTKLLIVVVVAAAAYGFWKNPQIVNQIKSSFETLNTDKAQVPNPQQQISRLNTQLQRLERQLHDIQNRQAENVDYASMNEKIAAIEKTNLNVIDSKADVATVLGLLTRLDKAEQKLDNMAKVTDEGALILTAAMLVKDGAERGGNFEYEAEVLQQIAQNNLNFKEAVETISQYAQQGIEPKEQLMKNFRTIYAKMLKVQKQAYEKTWKDRLNSKLSEIVQIKRVNSSTPGFEADQGLERVNMFVNNGNIRAAVAELQRTANAELLKNDELKKWMEQAQANVEFNNAVAKISASSLAVMKVNFLKNVTKAN